ncbi:MAG: tRNA (adenosine(37)-N6)-threonylcarbamoyltransferase complex dimerization subunit type 1 TsaB [Solirubrobacterales bacterium]|nr:tRNA (adenosine(37)-N6)-threonylcarbamoyltransferase complex dimerization subunit type 1 TsaB [Solirubrobacterales bacterium]
MPCTLALDTTTFNTAVAAVLDDDRFVEMSDIPGSDGKPGHASRALVLAENALAEIQMGWSDVSCVAVAVGPGSFTGLRVGIATAKAIAFGLGVRVVGASSLEALMSGVHEPFGSREAVALIDARRGELFASVLDDGRGERILSPADDESWTDSLPAGALCVGDGALLHARLLAERGFEVPEFGSPLHRISALQVARVGRHWPVGSEVLPHYLREADAVPTSERPKAAGR